LTVLRKGIIESKQNDDSAVSPPGDWIGIYVQSIAPTIPGILEFLKVSGDLFGVHESTV
jgi:hypothetical protein